MKIQGMQCDVCEVVAFDGAWIDQWLHVEGKDVCPECVAVIVKARQERLIDAVLRAMKEKND